MPSGGPQVVLAFDFGLRRIGVASGDTVTRLAAPVRTVAASAGEPRWEEIDKLLRELEPSVAVVGLPYNVDGSESGMTVAARGFAAELARRYRVQIAWMDERYSSLEAESRLKAARASGARRKRVDNSDVDAAAACVILDRWFSGQQ
jgi:putative Holliday junction resolvase